MLYDYLRRCSRGASRLPFKSWQTGYRHNNHQRTPHNAENAENSSGENGSSPGSPRSNIGSQGQQSTDQPHAESNGPWPPKTQNAFYPSENTFSGGGKEVPPRDPSRYYPGSKVEAPHWIQHPRPSLPGIINIPRVPDLHTVGSTVIYAGPGSSEPHTQTCRVASNPVISFVDGSYKIIETKNENWGFDESSQLSRKFQECDPSICNTCGSIKIGTTEVADALLTGGGPSGGPSRTYEQGQLQATQAIVSKDQKTTSESKPAAEILPETEHELKPREEYDPPNQPRTRPIEGLQVQTVFPAQQVEQDPSQSQGSSPEKSNTNGESQPEQTAIQDEPWKLTKLKAEHVQQARPLGDSGPVGGGNGASDQPLIIPVEVTPKTENIKTEFIQQAPYPFQAHRELALESTFNPMSTYTPTESIQQVSNFDLQREFSEREEQRTKTDLSQGPNKEQLELNILTELLQQNLENTEGKSRKEIKAFREEIVREIKDQTIENKMIENPVKEIVEMNNERPEEIAIIKDKATQNKLAEKPATELVTLKEDLMKKMATIEAMLTQNIEASQKPTQYVVKMKNDLMKEIAAIKDMLVQNNGTFQQSSTKVSVLKEDLLKGRSTNGENTHQNYTTATEKPVSEVETMKNSPMKKIADIKENMLQNSEASQKPVQEMATMKGDMSKEIIAMKANFVQNNSSSQKPAAKEIGTTKEDLLREMATTKANLIQNSERAHKAAKDFEKIKVDLMKELEAMKACTIETYKMATEGPDKKIVKMKDNLSMPPIKGTNNQNYEMAIEKPVQIIATMKDEPMKEIASLKSNTNKNVKLVEIPVKVLTAMKDELLKEMASIKEKTAENCALAAGKPVEEIKAMRTDLLKEMASIKDEITKRTVGTLANSAPLRDVEMITEVGGAGSLRRADTMELTGNTAKFTESVPTINDLREEMEHFKQQTIENTVIGAIRLKEIGTVKDQLSLMSSTLSNKGTKETTLGPNKSSVKTVQQITTGTTELPDKGQGLQGKSQSSPTASDNGDTCLLTGRCEIPYHLLRLQKQGRKSSKSSKLKTPPVSSPTPGKSTSKIEGRDQVGSGTNEGEKVKIEVENDCKKYVRQPEHRSPVKPTFKGAQSSSYPTSKSPEKASKCPSPCFPSIAPSYYYSTNSPSGEIPRTVPSDGRPIPTSTHSSAHIKSEIATMKANTLENYAMTLEYPFEKILKVKKDLAREVSAFQNITIENYLMALDYPFEEILKIRAEFAKEMANTTSTANQKALTTQEKPETASSNASANSPDMTLHIQNVEDDSSNSTDHRNVKSISPSPSSAVGTTRPGKYMMVAERLEGMDGLLASSLPINTPADSGSEPGGNAPTISPSQGESSSTELLPPCPPPCSTPCSPPRYSNRSLSVVQCHLTSPPPSPPLCLPLNPTCGQTSNNEIISLKMGVIPIEESKIQNYFLKYPVTVSAKAQSENRTTGKYCLYPTSKLDNIDNQQSSQTSDSKRPSSFGTSGDESRSSTVSLGDKPQTTSGTSSDIPSTSPGRPLEKPSSVGPGSKALAKSNSPVKRGQSCVPPRSGYVRRSRSTSLGVREFSPPPLLCPASVGSIPPPIPDGFGDNQHVVTSGSLDGGGSIPTARSKCSKTDSVRSLFPSRSCNPGNRPFSFGGNEGNTTNIDNTVSCVEQSSSGNTLSSERNKHTGLDRSGIENIDKVGNDNPSESDIVVGKSVTMSNSFNVKPTECDQKGVAKVRDKFSDNLRSTSAPSKFKVNLCSKSHTESVPLSIEDAHQIANRLKNRLTPKPQDMIWRATYPFNFSILSGEDPLKYTDVSYSSKSSATLERICDLEMNQDSIWSIQREARAKKTNSPLDASATNSSKHKTVTSEKLNAPKNNSWQPTGKITALETNHVPTIQSEMTDSSSQQGTSPRNAVFSVSDLPSIQLATILLLSRAAESSRMRINKPAHNKSKSGQISIRNSPGDVAYQRTGLSAARITCDNSGSPKNTIDITYHEKWKPTNKAGTSGMISKAQKPSPHNSVKRQNNILSKLANLPAEDRGHLDKSIRKAGLSKTNFDAALFLRERASSKPRLHSSLIVPLDYADADTVIHSQLSTAGKEHKISELQYDKSRIASSSVEQIQTFDRSTSVRKRCSAVSSQILTNHEVPDHDQKTEKNRQMPVVREKHLKLQYVKEKNKTKELPKRNFSWKDLRLLLPGPDEINRAIAEVLSFKETPSKCQQAERLTSITGKSQSEDFNHTMTETLNHKNKSAKLDSGNTLSGHRELSLIWNYVKSEVAKVLSGKKRFIEAHTKNEISSTSQSQKPRQSVLRPSTDIKLFRTVDFGRTALNERSASVPNMSEQNRHEQYNDYANNNETKECIDAVKAPSKLNHNRSRVNTINENVLHRHKAENQSKTGKRSAALQSPSTIPIPQSRNIDNQSKSKQNVPVTTKKSSDSYPIFKGPTLSSRNLFSKHKPGKSLHTDVSIAGDFIGLDKSKSETACKSFAVTELQSLLKSSEENPPTKQKSKVQLGPPGCPCTENTVSSSSGGSAGGSGSSSGGSKRTTPNDGSLPMKVKEGLNTQMATEMDAFIKYFKMMAHFGRVDIAYRGIESFFRKQVEEEREHALEIASWTNLRGGQNQMGAIGKECGLRPESLGSSHSAALAEAVSMEVSVTKSLHNLRETSQSSSDVITAKYVTKLFLREQTNSIDEISRLLTNAKRAESSPREIQTFDENLYARYKDQ